MNGQNTIVALLAVIAVLLGSNLIRSPGSAHAAAARGETYTALALGRSGSYSFMYRLRSDGQIEWRLYNGSVINPREWAPMRLLAAKDSESP